MRRPRLPERRGAGRAQQALPPAACCGPQWDHLQAAACAASKLQCLLEPMIAALLGAAACMRPSLSLPVQRRPCRRARRHRGPLRPPARAGWLCAAAAGSRAAPKRDNRPAATRRGAAPGRGRRNTSRTCRRCRAACTRAAPRPRAAACARRCSCRCSTRRAAARAWRAGPAARAAPRPRRTGRLPCWSWPSRALTRTGCWGCTSGCATGSRCARRRPALAVKVSNLLRPPGEGPPAPGQAAGTRSLPARRASDGLARVLAAAQRHGLKHAAQLRRLAVDHRGPRARWLALHPVMRCKRAPRSLRGPRVSDRQRSRRRRRLGCTCRGASRARTTRQGAQRRRRSGSPWGRPPWRPRRRRRRPRRPAAAAAAPAAPPAPRAAPPPWPWASAPGAAARHRAPPPPPRPPRRAAARPAAALPQPMRRMLTQRSHCKQGNRTLRRLSRPALSPAVAWGPPRARARPRRGPRPPPAVRPASVPRASRRLAAWSRARAPPPRPRRCRRASKSPVKPPLPPPCAGCKLCKGGLRT